MTTPSALRPPLRFAEGLVGVDALSDSQRAAWGNPFEKLTAELANVIKDAASTVLSIDRSADYSESGRAKQREAAGIALMRRVLAAIEGPVGGLLAKIAAATAPAKPVRLRDLLSGSGEGEVDVLPAVVAWRQHRAELVQRELLKLLDSDPSAARAAVESAAASGDLTTIGCLDLDALPKWLGDRVWSRLKLDQEKIRALVWSASDPAKSALREDLLGVAGFVLGNANTALQRLERAHLVTDPRADQTGTAAKIRTTLAPLGKAVATAMGDGANMQPGIVLSA